MLLNLLIFFLITQLSYYSIVGYGSLFKINLIKNIWLENFINFTIGIIIINLIGQIFYYFNINLNYLNLLILFIGLFLFNFRKNKKIIHKQIFLNIIFFSGLLISKLHEDWSYHFNFIEQISGHSPIIGIGNVDDIHILSSSFFSYVQKIFFLPLFKYKLILIPVYLTYLNIIIFLIHYIIENKNKLSFIFLIILTILTVKLSRISEFGYDYLSNFILLNIIILFLINKINKKKILLFKNIYILFFLYAVTIKITALFFAPILFYFLYEDFNEKKILIKNKLNFLFLILSLLFLIENFLRSGCFLYFVEYTCFDEELINWSIDYDRVIIHSKHVELWSKGFYLQKLIIDPIVYLDINNWFSVWVNNHFFYKVFEFILIPILFLCYTIFSENFTIKNKNYYKFLIFSVISLLIWLNFLPQLRFGISILIALSISLCLLFLEISEKRKFNNTNYIIIIVLIILIFNIKNTNRILNEIKRQDNHKFVNFPFPPEKRILSSKNSINSTKFLVHKGKAIKKYKWLNIIYEKY